MYKVVVKSKDGQVMNVMGYVRWLPETLEDAVELVKMLEKLCHNCVIQLSSIK